MVMIDELQSKIVSFCLDKEGAGWAAGCLPILTAKGPNRAAE